MAFIVMSVESGVGVVCGCLPGCKPLMNRVFPRIFASESENSSGRPSTARGVNKLRTGDSSQPSYWTALRTQESHRLQTLNTNSSGIIITDKRMCMARSEQSASVEPSLMRPSLMSLHDRYTETSRRELTEEDRNSNASSDLIILQRSSVHC